MIKIGINGFGRIGRLAFRAAVETDNLTVVAVNDPAGDAEVLAHLLNFDSIQGRWQHNATASDEQLMVTYIAAMGNPFRKQLSSQRH